MDHHIFFLWHMSADPLISIQIELPQKFHGNRCRPFCQFFIHRWITVLYIHTFPHSFCHRLIQRLNAKKSLSLSISFCQPFQHAQCKLHFFRHLCPFADTADSPVIKSILTEWHCMEIDQDSQSIFFRPVKCLVQFFDASDKRSPVTKDKIRYRDPDGIQSHSFDGNKISLCDVFRTMNFDSCFIYFRGKLPRKVIFIFRCGSLE